MNKYHRSAKEIAAIGLAILTTMSSVSAFAASTNVNSLASVNTTDDGVSVGYDASQDKSTSYQTTDEDTTLSSDVYATQASTFTATVPEIIILNGRYNDEGKNVGNFEVRVKGNIAGDEAVTVTPTTELALSSANKDDIPARVEQVQTSFTYDSGVRLEEEDYAAGTVTAEGMTAGQWHGAFDFNINLGKKDDQQQGGGGLDIEDPTSILEGYTVLNAYDLSSEEDDSVTGYYCVPNENTETIFSSNADGMDFIESAGDVVEKDGIRYTLSDSDKFYITGKGTIKENIQEDIQLDEPRSFIVGEGITGIAPYAFSECPISGLSIPSTMNNISEGAFLGSPYLTNVIVDKNNLKYDSRNNCNAVIETSTNTIVIGCANTVIPAEIENIGFAAFLGTPIETIELPENLKTIGWGAFALTPISNIEIPNKVTHIGELAFSQCENLEKLSYPANSIETISPYEFEGLTSLKEFVIPDGVTSVGVGAFKNCISLESLTVPDSVKSFGEDGYDYMYGDVVDGCENLTKINISSIESWCDISFGDGWRSNPLSFAHNLYLNNVLVTDLVIPNSVSNVNSCAFNGCTSINSITVSNETKIHPGAFEDCENLSDVYVPSLEYWLNNAFMQDNLLIKLHINGELITDLTIPSSITTIKGFLFDSCTNIKQVTIPDSVTSIGFCAFRNCTGLTSVTIPNSVNEIGCEAFKGCTKLETINIPNGVEEIGSGAFENCTSLTSVTIPNSVTKIGGEAFKGCTKLETINIPNGVEEIGSGAFENCTSLTSVTIPNSVTFISYNVFDSCINLKDIYYQGTEDEFKELVGAYTYNNLEYLYEIHYNS